MNIELKEIDKDSLKVGDVVGVAKGIQCGCRRKMFLDRCSYRILWK